MNVLAILLIVSNVAWLVVYVTYRRLTDAAIYGWRRANNALRRANDRAARLALENDRLYKLLDATDRGDA